MIINCLSFRLRSKICLDLIQLWRRVTDSSLIDECLDDIVIDDQTMQGVNGMGGICFERFPARRQSCKFDKSIPDENQNSSDLFVLSLSFLPSLSMCHMFIDQSKYVSDNATL